MKIVDLSEYGRRIFNSKSSPVELDSINIELTSWYAYYSEQLNSLDLLEAVFWSENKHVEGSKDRSDKELESMWKMTKDGKDHMIANRTVKTIEKLMSSLKASLRRAESESRGVY